MAPTQKDKNQRPRNSHHQWLIYKDELRPVSTFKATSTYARALQQERNLVCPYKRLPIRHDNIWTINWRRQSRMLKSRKVANEQKLLN